MKAEDLNCTTIVSKGPSLDLKKWQFLGSCQKERLLVTLTYWSEEICNVGFKLSEFLSKLFIAQIHHYIVH